MDTINIKELVGYREDTKARRDFERPYAFPSLAGAVVFLFGFILLISESEAGPYYKGQQADLLQRIWFQIGSAASHAGVSPRLLTYLPFVAFAVGFLLLLTTGLLLGNATPISHITGTPMDRFLNADAPAGVKEIVYVDRAAQTYFRRVISRVSRGGVLVR